MMELMEYYRNNYRSIGIRAMAGPAAWRFAVRRKPDGWRRHYEKYALVAIEEAGHAVSGRVLCFRPAFQASLVPRVYGQIVQMSFVSYSADDDHEQPPVRDQRQASEMARLVAVIDNQPLGWKTYIRIAREFRAEAERLVQQHWPIIQVVAGEL